MRTTLTTLGVAIGIASLVSMVSLGVGLQEQTVGRFLKSGMFDSITVFSRQAGAGFNFQAARRRPRANSKSTGMSQPDKPSPPLDDAALKKISSLDRVKEVYPNLRVPLEVKFGDFSEFSAATGVPMSTRGEGVFQKIAFGSFFPNDTDDVCMVSLDFASRMTDKDPKDLVGKEVTLGYASGGNAQSVLNLLGGMSLQRVEKKFRIVGIVEREPGPNFAAGIFSAVMIPLRKAQQMGVYDFSTPQAFLRQLSQKPSYASLTVRVSRPQDTDDVEKKIKDLGFNAFSINDALQGAKRAFIILDIILGVIGSIALAVASLGIVNTMVMSILERTREIGVMKAIGGSEGDIRKIFLVESCIIGLMGGLIGIALGWVVGKTINFGANFYIQRQGGTPGQLFFIPWWLVACGVGFSILVSLIAGSYPAARAARVDPIKALRHD
ncbi:MAG TPA: ABC transporter permease [Acidobacteriota bacterium]|nr:ABC transporter permease [Acidobacteriota bacterium]